MMDKNHPDDFTPNDFTPNDFIIANEREKARLDRGGRVKLAFERAWYYFCTRGKPEDGYRLPLNELAVNSAMYVGVSWEMVVVYLKEGSGTGWDTPDTPNPYEFPFMLETFSR